MSIEILVPLDGSATAEHALPAAVALARRCGGTLHLCRVCPPVELASSEEQPRRGWRERARALAYVRRLRDRLGAAFKVRVCASVRVGVPADSILREAHFVGAELLVLTTHGTRGSGPRWIGTTADAVVRGADCPVLLLPPRRGAVDWERGSFRRVLLPVEEGSYVDAMLAGTDIVCGDPPMSYCLFQLGDGHEGAGSAVTEESTGQIEGVGVWTSATSQGEPPAAAIMRAAREFDADLIVFTLSAGESPEAAPLSPVVAQFVLMAPLPLLLHRPVARRPLALPALALPSPDDDVAPGPLA